MAVEQLTPQETPTQLIEQKIFGSDGVRGGFTHDQTPGLVNTTTAKLLAFATTEMLMAKQGGDQPATVVIGHDPRESSPELIAAMASGVRAAGGRVVYLGMVPTPAVFWAAKHLNATMSGIVTASHNPGKDNGFKFGEGGDKLLPEQQDEVTRRFWEIVRNGWDIPDEDFQPEECHPELVDAYVDAVVADIQGTFGEEQPLANNLYVFDGSNGAASDVTPKILEKLGATVERFACDPNGVINENCGAANLEGVKQFLRNHPEIVRHPKFKGVICHDGDADRVILLGARVSEKGEVEFSTLDGNLMIEMMAERRLATEDQNGRELTTVGTDYTNRAIIARLGEQGVRVVLCENGDINVTMTLEEEDALDGAEFSGHVVQREWGSSGDGPHMAAWVVANLADQDLTVDRYCRARPLWPEKMIPVKELPGVVDERLLATRSVALAIKWASLRVGRKGSVLVRLSGTEAGVVRVWTNGKNAKQVNKQAERIERKIRQTATRQAQKRAPKHLSNTR